MSDTRPVQFGRMPTALVTSGALKPIKGKPAALAVYIAYVAASNAEGEAWPSEATIAAAFDLGADTVRRARRILEDAGLLIDTGHRRHRCKVYRIASKPRDAEGFQNPATWGGNDSKPRDAEGYETPHGRGVSPRNPARRAAETPRRGGTNRVEQRKSTTGHRFPLRGRGEWTLPADRLDEYRSTFPGLDVDAELRKARLWLLDNPDRRKTARGMPRFLSGWLTRAKPADAGTTRNGDGYPTSEDLDRVCPLVEPTEADFAAIAAELARKDATP